MLINWLISVSLKYFNCQSDSITIFKLFRLQSQTLPKIIGYICDSIILYVLAKQPAVYFRTSHSWIPKMQRLCVSLHEVTVYKNGTTGDLFWEEFCKLQYQGCPPAEPSGLWRLIFVLGRLENLCFSIEIICWAHWISQVQSTGLPSILLRAQPWICVVSLYTLSHTVHRANIALKPCMKSVKWLLTIGWKQWKIIKLTTVKSGCGYLKEVIPSIRLRLEKFCYVGGYTVEPCYFEVPREMEKSLK